MQLAVNVQIPPAFGGLGGKAIYIGWSFLRDVILTVGESVTHDKF